MNAKGTKAEKRKVIDLPLCKYGSSCYQKNSEHRKKFKHPTGNKIKVNSSKVNKDTTPGGRFGEYANLSKNIDVPQTSVGQMNDSGENYFDDPEESSISENVDNYTQETVGDILKSMPKDFFDFWKFCTSINKSKPQDAFSEYGYHLVGIFDLLAKKLPKDMKIDISCHWRYYFDIPELQTVIKKDGSDWYHIGYFRDDPLQKPSILVSNSAAFDSKLTVMGDNIFCAMNAELSKVMKSLNSKVSKDKASKLQKDLTKLAAAKDYQLNVKTEKTKERQKKVVAKTFNGLGFIVPVENGIGYRSLPYSNNGLKTMLEKIVSAESEVKQLQEQEALDGIISCVHFANDECDFGMGLELGIDLFCDGNAFFHEHIMRILPLAYDLLKRSKYASIVRAHLKDRRKGENLSTLN